MYLCVRASLHKTDMSGVTVEVRKQPWLHTLALHLVWGKFSCFTKYTRLVYLRVLPTSAPHLTTGVQGLLVLATITGFSGSIISRNAITSFLVELSLDNWPPPKKNQLRVLLLIMKGWPWFRLFFSSSSYNLINSYF